MKIDTIDKLPSDYAKTLIGKHIHFTWHNTFDNTNETMPGKVLDYQNGKIKIDTMDIIMLDDCDKESNMTKVFDIEDISDIFVFEKYTKEFYKLLDNINEHDLNTKEFEITTVFGDSIKSRILNYSDSLFITIVLDDERYDYPLYFIESIKMVD